MKGYIIFFLKIRVTYFKTNSKWLCFGLLDSHNFLNWLLKVKVVGVLSEFSSRQLREVKYILDKEIQYLLATYLGCVWLNMFIKYFAYLVFQMFDRLYFLILNKFIDFIV